MDRYLSATQDCLFWGGGSEAGRMTVSHDG